MSFTTEIFSEPSCFESLSREWHELLSRAHTNHIFMIPEFQKSWWTTLGEGELHVIAVRDEDHTLVGLALLFTFINQSGLKQLSFVGCVNVSDYLDLIITREKSAEIYEALWQAINNRISWQQIFFCSIPQVSPTLSQLQSFAQTHHFQTQQLQQDVCPILELPSSWEEYLTVIGKKQRHEIKRKWQNLEKETDAQFEVITKPEEIRTSMNDFISLHQKSSAEKKNFWDENHVHFFQAFAEEIAEKGWLKLYFLKIKNRRVATMLGFDYNRQFFLYNSGFDAEDYRHLSVGNVLTAYTIKDAIETGKKRYDFLRGNEEYKFRFGAVAEPIFDVLVQK